LFFAGQTKHRSVRFARVSGVLFFAGQTKLKNSVLQHALICINSLQTLQLKKLSLQKNNTTQQ
jgi:hypothetical protein